MTEIPKVGDRVRINQRPIEGVVRERAVAPGHYAVFNDAAAVCYLGQLDQPTYGLEVLERAAYPDGTVAVSESAPDEPAVKRNGVWTPTYIWPDLTDGTVRSNRYFTVVHEPQAR